MSVNKQSGHVGIIVGIVLLVLVILGLLAWVLWNNFGKKDETAVVSVTSFEECKAAEGSKMQLTFPEQCITAEGKSFTGPSTTAPDENALTETGTLTNLGHTLSFQYPKTWTNKDGVLTSADGTVNIRYSIFTPEGLGGACGDDGSITDPIIQASWAAIPGAKGMVAGKSIAHIQPTQYSELDYYTYHFAAMENTDSVKNAKAGDSSCPVYLFADYIALDPENSGPILRFVVSFTNLEDKEGGYPRNDLTLTEIETAFKSTAAITAQKVIESLVVK